MAVQLLVELDRPEPVPGVKTLSADALPDGVLPPADAVIIPADSPRGERLFSLSAACGAPILFFQGYGTPGSEIVRGNLARARRVLAVAAWLQEDAERLGARTRLVRYGIDRSVFHPAPERTPAREPSTRHAAQAGPPSVAMMTSPVTWKGTEDGLEAIRLAREAVPELDARFFGHTAPGVPGTFSLHPRPDEVAELLRGSTVFVCPSWEEGFGLPGLEAMFCGAALATTDTMGSRDYALDGQTALVTPPRDPAALARSIVRLVSDAPLRRSLVSAAARHAANTFPDWTQAGGRFAQAIRDLVAEE